MIQPYLILLKMDALKIKNLVVEKNGNKAIAKDVIKKLILTLRMYK